MPATSIVNEKTPNAQPKNCSWFCPDTGVYSSKHPPMQLPADQNLDIVSFIFSHKLNTQKPFLIDSSSGFSLSYSKMLPLVRSLSSLLLSKGVSKGDVVLILLPNSIYYPAIFLSVLYIGAVATTMNPLSSVLEIKKQVLECEVKYAFAELNKVEKLTEFGVGHVIAMPETLSSGCQVADFINFLGLSPFFSDSAPSPRPVINQQDTAAIVYSSGTTGGSKGVVLTHGNLIASAELFVRFEASQYEGSSFDNVYLAVLPMFHIYGLSMFVIGLLSLGSSIVLMKKFNAEEVVKVIDRFGVTHFPVVPPILAALTMKVKSDGGSRSRLKSLKQVSCGASPLTGKAIEDFVEALPHVDFIQGYGSTESTAVGTRGFNCGKQRKYSSIGLLAPNTQAKVVNWVNGSLLPPGNSGELWLRCPGVMKGYLKNKEATLETVDEDGWLRTGDIVYFDEDGYLYIVDRLKEMIKYKGFQIAPADLETVLMTHPEILDAAVTGVKDEEAGEVPVAFVVRRQGSMLSHADIMDYVASKVAPYKKVRKVVFTKSIPRSPAGKILRRQLRTKLVSRI